MTFIIILTIVIIAALILQIRPPSNSTRKLETLLPIYKIEKDCIISKHGDITIAFQLELPEIFTLSEDDYENLHQSWQRAIKILPAGTVIHKQDWYTNAKYKKDKTAGTSFLKSSSEKYFEGRPYRKHQCFLMITRKSDSHKPSNSVYSNLLKPSIIANKTIDPHQFNEFTDKCGQMQKIIIRMQFN